MNTKKILALVVAAVMVMSCFAALSLGVFAETGAVSTEYTNVEDIVISCDAEKNPPLPSYTSTGATFGKHLSIPTGKRLKQFSVQTVTGGPDVSGKLSYAIYAFDEISVETTLLDSPIYASAQDVECTDWGTLNIDIPQDTIIKGEVVVVFVVTEGSGAVVLDSKTVNTDIVMFSYIAPATDVSIQERQWEASIQLADWIVEEETQAPAEDVTDAPAEDVTDAPTEDVTNAPAEQVTDAPAEQVTDAPAEQVTDAPAEEVTNAPAEEVTNAPAEDVTDAPAEDATSDDETDAVADTGDTVAEAEDDGLQGCSSVISMGGVSLLAAMAAAVVLRKKRED